MPTQSSLEIDAVASRTEALVTFASLLADVCGQTLGNATTSTTVDVATGVWPTVYGAVATSTGDVAARVGRALHLAATFRTGEGTVAAFFTLTRGICADCIVLAGPSTEAEN